MKMVLHPRNGTHITTQTKQPSPIMMGFNNRLVRKINFIPVIPLQIQRNRDPIVYVPTIPYSEKMPWGAPIWTLFHTLAFKVHDSTFSQIRPELLNILYKICLSLPCPNCSSHAKTTLDMGNFNMITSKQHLQTFLFNFHNQLNEEKGVAPFTIDAADKKYSDLVTVDVLNEFMTVFTKKNGSVRLILADSVQRTRFVSYLKTWFQNNISMFDP